MINKHYIKVIINDFLEDYDPSELLNSGNILIDSGNNILIFEKNKNEGELNIIFNNGTDKLHTFYYLAKLDRTIKKWENIRKNINHIIIHKNNKYCYSDGNFIFNKKDNRIIFATNFNVLPKNEKVSIIHNFVFAYSNINKIKIESNINEIGYLAFDSSNVKSVDLSESKVKVIKQSTFEDCHFLSSVSLPPCLNEIHKHAFCNTNLISIDIPDSVYLLGESINKKTDKNIQITDIDFDLSSGNDIFNRCYGLKYVNLSKNLLYLPTICFYECSSILSVEIPKNIQKIGEMCFTRNISMEKLVFKVNDSLEIGKYAFLQCSSLNEIIFEVDDLSSLSNININYAAFRDTNPDLIKIDFLKEKPLDFNYIESNFLSNFINVKHSYLSDIKGNTLMYNFNYD